MVVVGASMHRIEGEAGEGDGRMLLTGALVSATWYTITYGIGYPGYTAGGAWGEPLVMGLILGAFMGDMATAVTLGAYIMSIYLGIITPGGNIPADSGAAGAIAIPIALASGMDTGAAMALAVPIGLLFSILSIVKYLLDGLFCEPAERAADACDMAKIWRCGFLYPIIVKAIIVWPLIFCSVYFGADFVTSILNAIPEWLSHGLSVAGGMLPSLGFALTIMVIGQKKYVPLFLIGYFMVQYGSLSVMACAIFSICIALFATFFRSDVVGQAREGLEEEEDDDEDAADVGDEARILGKGDASRFFLRWWLFCEVPHSYQKMQALSVCNAMVPALKKMYPGKEHEEELSSALHRELMYFNTEGIWGSSALGVALAMEEEQAITRAMTPDEATATINGVKVGFMGPFAGVGDTIDWGILFYLLIGIGLPYAMEGNPMGVLPFMLGYPAITIAEGLFFTNLGYRLGTSALQRLFTGGMVARVIECSSMIGMMMMGALGSSYVSLSLANEAAQATLDGIVPGLLPLLLIFGVLYVLEHVTQKMQWLSLGILALGILTSFLGIF